MLMSTDDVSVTCFAESHVQFSGHVTIFIPTKRFMIVLTSFDICRRKLTDTDSLLNFAA